MRVAKHSLAINAMDTNQGRGGCGERKFCWGVECGAEIWYNMW